MKCFETYKENAIFFPQLKKQHVTCQNQLHNSNISKADKQNSTPTLKQINLLHFVSKMGHLASFFVLFCPFDRPNEAQTRKAERLW